MVSLRLTADVEHKLEQVAKAQNISKSAVIKKALEQYFQTHDSQRSPYELGEELFGKYGSGQTDLSQNYKQLLKNKLRAKRSH